MRARSSSTAAWAIRLLLPLGAVGHRLQRRRAPHLCPEGHAETQGRPVEDEQVGNVREPDDPPADPQLDNHQQAHRDADRQHAPVSVAPDGIGEHQERRRSRQAVTGAVDDAVRKHHERRDGDRRDRRQPPEGDGHDRHQLEHRGQGDGSRKGSAGHLDEHEHQERACEQPVQDRRGAARPHRPVAGQPA